MRFLLRFLLFAGIAGAFSARAQETFPVNGPYDQRDGLYAFTNATLFKSYHEKIENATLLIRNGKVEAVGLGVAIPKDAVVIDLKNKYIYPSFIDVYSNYGMPDVKPEGQAPTQLPQMLSNKKGAFHWNEALRPEFSAAEAFHLNDAEAAKFRSSGFGAVLTHRMDGISRGTGAFVTLGADKEHLSILRDRASHQLSLDKGSSTQDYPSSQMGAIALLRQAYLDGQWYKTSGYLEERNISLDAWNQVQNLPQFFSVNEKKEVLRACRIAREFGLRYIIKGGGDEYQRLDEIKATGCSLVLPLAFPDVMDIEDPYDALQVSITDLKHWELAPTNPGRLEKAGIEFALTTYGLADKGDFFKKIQKAIENGLSEEGALKALTLTPATLAGMQDQIGTLDKGKVANFLITSGNIFDKDTKLFQNWIQGKPFQIKDLNAPDLNGIYDLSIGNLSYQLIVTGADDYQMTVQTAGDSVKSKVDFRLQNQGINLSFFLPKDSLSVIRLSGTVAPGVWSGKGTTGDGVWVNWKASYTGPARKNDPRPVTPPANDLGPVIYPFSTYGSVEKPKPGIFLIRNATVWTNEKDGILKNTDVLIQGGKIVKIGNNLPVNDAAQVIDAAGKHLTSGIIDEHSHIAASGSINEGTQASSAEVRIGDIIDSDDSDIYRQLAGGVTASHILHGSANPIGGQTQLIKLRWGYAPEELKFDGWDGFIKFALGENVKGSNGGDNYNIRYPQSRMGVEQLYEDFFNRAEEYGRLKTSGKPYRTDLELEALLEILQKKRFITCHSYQQGEINMLMKVAERHNFRVNTFTHILEGYKVADKMKKHGAGAAGFSDWWDYKYEVYDAIPYNSALLYENGVVTGINSDDAEMARRLNQEAAKAIKYGNVPDEEAWKMVTLNPAKLLHVDKRTGSVKTGKDADVVLWSDNPLSIYARAEMTWVDGTLFFDRKADLQKREDNRIERARLIRKMIAAKKSGEKVVPVEGRRRFHYDCDGELMSWETENR